MRFSQFFRIGSEQSQYDFVDVPLDRDIRLFLDPFAVAIANTVLGEECHILACDFFQSILNRLRAGDRTGAMSLLSHLREENRTRTGYSKNEPRGNGLGSHKSGPFLDAIENSEAFKTGQINDIEDSALFVDRIGFDIVSDMLINVLREKLAEYTRDQCEWYGIPTDTSDAFYAWRKGQGWFEVNMSLPIDGKRTILLLPRSLARKDLSLEAGRYYRSFLDYHDQGNTTAEAALAKMLQIVPKKKGGSLNRKDLTKKLKDKGSLKNTMSRLTQDCPEALERYRDAARGNRPMLTPAQIEELQPDPIDTALTRNIAETLDARLNAGAIGDAVFSVAGALLGMLHPYLQHPRRLPFVVNGFSATLMANTGSKGIWWDARNRGGKEPRRNIVILASAAPVDDFVLDQVHANDVMERANAGLILLVAAKLEQKVLSRRAKLMKAGTVVCTTDELAKISRSNLDADGVMKAIRALAA